MLVIKIITRRNASNGSNPQVRFKYILIINNIYKNEILTKIDKNEKN